MAKPVLLAVDSDREVLAALERDLSRRFAADYGIVTADTPEAALANLANDDQLALVMAGQWLTGTAGVDLLNVCHQIQSTAKRLLLIAYGDSAGGNAAVRAIALGQLDHYVNKPWGNPELELYPRISDLLSPAKPRGGGRRHSARGRAHYWSAVVGPLP